MVNRVENFKLVEKHFNKIWVLLDWPIGRKPQLADATIGLKIIFTSKKEIKQFSTIINANNIELYSFSDLLPKSSKPFLKNIKYSFRKNVKFLSFGFFHTE